MQLSDSTQKMEIVERLVKDGAIDFTEAIKLLEKEPEYIFSPTTQPFQPYQPFQPITPVDDWWNRPPFRQEPIIHAGVITSVNTGVLSTN